MIEKFEVIKEYSRTYPNWPETVKARILKKVKPTGTHDFCVESPAHHVFKFFNTLEEAEALLKIYLSGRPKSLIDDKY